MTTLRFKWWILRLLKPVWHALWGPAPIYGRSILEAVFPLYMAKSKFIKITTKYGDTVGFLNSDGVYITLTDSHDLEIND